MLRYLPEAALLGVFRIGCAPPRTTRDTDERREATSRRAARVGLRL